MTGNGNPSKSPGTARQNAQALVSAANAAYGTGDLALAEQLLIQATELQAGYPDALQLLALLAKRKGDLRGAEKLLRESLKGDSKQPHVHNNLGNLLFGQGNAEEAAAHYALAVRLKPDYVDALVNLAAAYIKLERRPEAEPLYAKALRMSPGHAGAVIGMVEILSGRGDDSGAEALLREALAASPGNLYFTNGLSVLLNRTQRFAEALPLAEKAVAAAPNRAEPLMNHANILSALGRVDEAIEGYSRIIGMDPANYAAHETLSGLLWEEGREREIGRSYAYAKSRLPGNPDVLEQSAQCLLLYDRLDEAEADIAAAEAIRPHSIAQARLWTLLRLKRKQLDSAVATAAMGLHAFPNDRELLVRMIEGLLRSGRAGEALAAARHLQTIEPDGQLAVGFEVAALRHLGDPLAARIYDYDKVVREIALPAPEGYGDSGAFNRHLADVLKNLHIAKQEPRDQTLRNGTQTRDNLFTRPGLDPAVHALGATVMAAVKKVIGEMPDGSDHPFFRRKTTDVIWSGSWSVKLRGEGFHVDHVHNLGWISGVYYVEVPPCVEDAVGKPGWLKLGAFDQGIGPTLPWERAIQPKPGLMVLFPSFMWHGTIPITGDASRVTVAFDIAPRTGSR